MSHTTTYGFITKLFHWITAALILAIIPLGVIANDMGVDTNEALATKAYLFSWHKTLGVTIFFVALLRILWALTQTKPGSLHPERKVETFMSGTVHWLLYGSLVLAPLTGWIHHAATSGFAPIWWPFGQSLPFVPKDDGVAHLFGGMHWAFSKVMIGSLILHIAGALKHHFVDHDATLMRMWFGKTAAPETDQHVTKISAPFTAAVILVLGAGLGAYLGSQNDGPVTQAASLEAVASDWTVQDGALEITVNQFGSPITGSFADWTAAITFDPTVTKGEAGDVEVQISIGSLTLGSITDQAMGPDFFDSETYPTATFAATITGQDDGYVADATLALKGASVPVSMPFDLTVDGDTATMTGQVTLNRTNYDVGQSMTDESNVGFEVVVDVNLTATQAPN